MAVLTPLVVLESPYSGRGPWPLSWWRRLRNKRFARACVRDSLMRGESCVASHLLYTQPGILRDGVVEERCKGIIAGLAWLPVADASVVYVDNGISSGMKIGIEAARAVGIPVVYRLLRKPEVKSADALDAWLGATNG